MMKDDIRNITKEDWEKVVRIYREWNKVLQLWTIYFWWWVTLIAVILIYLFPEYQIYTSIVAAYGLYITWKREWDFNWYLDGYSHGLTDWINKAFKKVYTMTDDDIARHEEMSVWE